VTGEIAGARGSFENGAAYVAALEDVLGTHWPGVAQWVTTQREGVRELKHGDLLRPDRIASQIARFVHAHPDADDKALASLWTQWYAATTWPALVAGAVLLGSGPRLADTVILLDNDARPAGLRIASVTPVGVEDFLESLTREQARPLMAAAAATGVSPRVPWSNAINVLGWMLDQLRCVTSEARLAHGFAVLDRPVWPDGTTNPLAAPGGSATGRPARRVCCLRYRLQGFDYCGDCPIPIRSR